MQDATISGQDRPECRALVILNPTQPRPAQRPQAAFVMQLIACDRRLGTYRTARQASSTEAASVYRSRSHVPSRSLQRVV